MRNAFDQGRRWRFQRHEVARVLVAANFKVAGILVELLHVSVELIDLAAETIAIFYVGQRLDAG